MALLNAARRARMRVLSVAHMPCVKRYAEIRRTRYNNLPLALLALYFLVSFAESFPLTAYGQWFVHFMQQI